MQPGNTAAYPDRDEVRGGYRGAVDQYAAVLLAGGAARRMAGVDKPAVPVGGRPMRDRVLAAVADAHPRIVVGPPDGLPAGVLTAREDPPGSGPVAALAAGLARLAMAAPARPGTDISDLSTGDTADLSTADPSVTVTPTPTPTPTALPGSHPWPVAPIAHPAVAVARPEAVVAPSAPHLTHTAPRPELVAVLAADLPFLTAEAVASLRRHCTRDGALFVDGNGRRQLLCGVWRIDSLLAATARLAEARGGTLVGASMRALLDGLDVTEVTWGTGSGSPGRPDPTGPERNDPTGREENSPTGPGNAPPPWFDCDTVDDVRRAEEWTR
ncbi:NTP transferase domain-containing protein [Polymorphospora sp. NPDC050346]|uniref:molybdenum cofactor guanylyltransferase n=1 Tax=Polymorphospora sp. NPDC050346 TaxID=3155780 RepID=UPI0033E326D2